VKEMRSNRGVLLFAFGGPATLDEVRPFLVNLFSDPNIIGARSAFLRGLLARLIASARQHRSRELYRQIGGGSPLGRITAGQAAALRGRLAAHVPGIRVYVGMRYCRPTIEEAWDRIRRDGIAQLVALPLFPQFSVTTTGSCFRCFQELLQQTKLAAETEISYVDAWFDEPLYLESMADLIQEALGRFSGRDMEKVHLLYSAHSIPAKYVERGDPYLLQTERTVELINARMGNALPSTLAFQSKFGPVRWLGPSTSKVLAQLGRAGTGRILLIPVSFVSDHIETLQEMDISYRKLAAEAGIKEFQRAAALNLHPKFIDALAAVALRALGNVAA
jgi:protoporphyrin/coproporphyrin ferrochelatase